MARSALFARVSNHESDAFLILRDAARRPLLRMRVPVFRGFDDAYRR
jgi:hypothetical protein